MELNNSRYSGTHAIIQINLRWNFKIQDFAALVTDKMIVFIDESIVSLG